MSGLPNSDSIGLMGGSFDPVHNGHIAIVKSFMRSGFLDQLFVLLTPNPPHKEDRELTDYNHRLSMLNLALEGIPNTSASDIEKSLPEPSYTVNTVAHIKEQHPESTIYLCLGEDSLHEFTTWYRWQKILEMCSLLVAQRPNGGTSNEEVEEKLKKHVTFIDHDPIDISSSELRKKLMAGSDVSGILPAKVLNYIRNHNLYSH